MEKSSLAKQDYVVWLNIPCWHRQRGIGLYLSAYIYHVLNMINYAFVHYKHGSVQSTILIPFMVCYIYHVNAYGLNPVVFNEVYKWYAFSYSIIDPVLC